MKSFFFDIKPASTCNVKILHDFLVRPDLERYNVLDDGQKNKYQGV